MSENAFPLAWPTGWPRRKFPTSSRFGKNAPPSVAKGREFLSLDISADATEPQILDAYRRAARKAHPDAGGSAEEFVKVSQAKDIALATLQSRRAA